ncbi:methyltransferase GidB [Luminiphilus syltensis NOR5-1B]|uniref:Ribosomal RNA small subunit methyltransferase G n=1 Tax=Luminiphilus syltensis NOR5-1B TaxID=565045 RepID=B8KUE0_9GAMM|nr:16S rRNA (guanine(527)-N(7))-methyltransferase RsmG [Luminiphilus syltensis]EED34726.1 methyltransferase GidB [Luminiphilus syltensis NOR5-1B]
MADEALRRLQSGVEEINLNLVQSQFDQLLDYVDLMLRWNRAYNLTAVREKGSMVVRHLLDALVISPLLQGKRLIDVGTGPGIPGVPLAIVQPERHFTLLDGNGKKTRFLFQVKSQLGLSNIEIVEQRVENFRPHDSFDAVITRAFADLATGCRVCGHLMDADTVFYAMKSSCSREELEAVGPGYRVLQEYPLEVPFLKENRTLVVLKRASKDSQP